MNVKLARDHNLNKNPKQITTRWSFSLPVSIYLFALVFVIVRNKKKSSF